MGQSLRRKHDITQTYSPPKKIWDGGTNVSQTSEELATQFNPIPKDTVRVRCPVEQKGLLFYDENQNWLQISDKVKIIG